MDSQKNRSIYYTLLLCLISLMACASFLVISINATAVPDNEISSFSSDYDSNARQGNLKSDNQSYMSTLKNDLYTKKTKNSDGTWTLEVYGTPVRYIEKDGAIKDINLKPIAKGDGFASGDHFIYAEFPQKIEKGVLLRTGESDIRIIPIAPDGNSIVSSKQYIADDDKIVYCINENVSYEYGLTYSGYKETIIVSEYSGQNDFLFRVFTNGLSLVCEDSERNSDCSISFVDSNNHKIAEIGDVIGFSADNRNNIFGIIDYETVEKSNEYIIRISVPENYLSSNATHYPIYVDPTISVIYNSEDSTTWNGIEDITVNQNHTTDWPGSGTLYVGKAGQDYGAMRSVMRFPYLDLSDIIPSDIISAVVHIRDLMCYSYNLQVDCYGFYGYLPTGTFTQTNVTWDSIYYAMYNYETGGVFHSSNNVYYNHGVSHTNWYDFNILPIVKDWAQHQTDSTFSGVQQAIVFKSTDNYELSSNEHYVCFGSFDRGTNKPYLTIKYNEPSEYSVSLNRDSLSLLVGNGFRLISTTEPANQSVVWTSSNPSVATVNSYGYISTNSTGYAIITASVGDATASCSLIVSALDGVFEIKIPSDSDIESEAIFLSDINDGLNLTENNPWSRTQLWLIKNINGTPRYTLNPLSKTTIDYTGFDIGLGIGGEGEIPEPLLLTISSENQVLDCGQWYITGDEINGFVIRAFTYSDYSVLVRNNSGTRVWLEYDENIINEDTIVENWILSKVEMLMYSSVSSSINTADVFQDSRLSWLPYISATDTNAAEQRIKFSSSDRSRAFVNSIGMIFISSNCPNNYTVQIDAACGMHTAQITVTTKAYGDFGWSEDYCAETGRINLDNRIVWIEMPDGNLLTTLAGNTILASPFSNDSFNHEWRIIMSGTQAKIQSVDGNMVLKVCTNTADEGALISLGQPTNSISEYFRFERIGSENYYIITTASSEYSFAIAYNSITEEFYQTNRLNSADLLLVKIGEGGKARLPTGYYCMGNPFTSSGIDGSSAYFYLINENDTARLGFFSRTEYYPYWFLLYQGNGYYSIINDNEQIDVALTYTNGNVGLASFLYDDSQLWECVRNSDFTFSFKPKGQNLYLMRDDSYGAISHSVTVGANCSPAEAGWKMIRLTSRNPLFDYGKCAVVFFFSCKSAGFNEMDFSTSMVKAVIDGGADYAIGCQGDGYCDDFQLFISFLIEHIGINNDDHLESDYKAAFVQFAQCITNGCVKTDTVFKDSDELTAGGNK